jgi:lysophospholipase L1-like esterase
MMGPIGLGVNGWHMRIALYGDSMTEYLHNPPRVLTEHLQRREPRRTFEVLNYGIGATRAELVLYRLLNEYWHGRQRMLPLAVLQPDVIVLESCCGNNGVDREDGLKNFAYIWDQIIAACRAHAPAARLIAYLSIASSPQVPAESANRLFFRASPEIFAYRHHWRTVYQEAFAHWAGSNKLELVDVRSHVLAQEKSGTPRHHWIAADGVHPNAAGVELISSMLAAAILPQQHEGGAAA